MNNNSIVKQITVLMLISIISFSLVACNDKDSSKVTESTEVGENAHGKYTEEITYTLGRLTVQNSKLPEGDTYENNAYTRYVKEKLNAVCVDAFEANGEDYDRQVSLAISSGDLPDMMRVGDKNILDELVENDLIADLTEVYDTYGSDYLKSIYDSYDGRALDTAMYDGKLMALPGTNVDSAPSEVWIRQDWLDKLDIIIDEDGNGCITIEELEMVAKTFREKDPGNSGNPIGIPLAYWLNSNDYGGSNHCMTGIANAFGAYPKLWLQDEGGNIYYGSTTKETKEALGVVKKWYQEGILDPQFGTRTWDDITALLINGQSGIVFGAWHIPDWLLNNIRAMDNNAVFSAYVIEDENGKANVFHNNASNGFIVVRKGYEYPELAIKIANIFYDEFANSKTLATDAPEVSKYHVDAVDGATRPFNIEINKYTSLLDDYSDIRRGVNGEIPIEEARTVESRVIIENVTKYLKDYENSNVTDWAKYHSRMKGVALIEKLTNEGTFNWVNPVFWGTTDTMKTNWANLEKLEEEMFIKIIIGATSLDEFDAFVNDWNKQGGAQIIKEIQETLK
ncbi:type 2 periplasmic-binding domain-containing protein [Vallitalea maricola]|uniref:Uncharacterized protein n=1 Tax=Vallitalea maricola TaxID=3074433 RepID=A0ACB5UKV3_9FIRM|nr:hypothetical protein AN2V17_24060 [Vallitalea sp. AN17-2]